MNARLPPLYSGLETSGMLMARSSLRLQPNSQFEPVMKQLAPRRNVLVTMDGSPNRHVNFQGCTVLQLNPIGSGGVLILPPILTIAGPCYYSRADKQDFEYMMRTKQKSREMGLPPNGDMDWPNHEAFEMCPCCGAAASPSDDTKDEYMMLFYPLMQAGPRGLGIRCICRLTCVECFESLVDGMTLSAIAFSVPEGVPFQVSVLDAVEDQGPITWLERGHGMGKRDAKTMSAYSLYQAWEYTGAWQCLQEMFANEITEAMSRSGKDVEVRDTRIESKQVMNEYYEEQEEHWVMRSTTKTGRTCSGPGCGKVHRSVSESGKKIRLHFCAGCQDTLYCGSTCQSNHWEEHKPYCKAKQREAKEAEKERMAQKEAEEKARMDAVAASFAPLSLLDPQGGGGGSKKKNNKKKGGKKKRKGKK